jgi:hypothetical protein
MRHFWYQGVRSESSLLDRKKGPDHAEMRLKN